MSFDIKRGTNISHWLSQSRARGEQRRAWFTRENARKLAELGFDHVRLPVDEEQMWDEAGRREPEAWELMNACLDWCGECGLRVIVDLHILRSHHFNQGTEATLFTDPKEAERFAGLWRDLSADLKRRPVDQVAYELMNEAVATDPEDWNRVYHAAYAALRELEPERVIVIGSNRWNSVFTFDKLRVPQGDPNLLLTFHYYLPMLVTHHQAWWWALGKIYSGPVQYPGRPIPDAALAALPEEIRTQLVPENHPYDAKTMERDLELPLAVAARTGLKLYCGEFGVLNTVPDATRAAWYRDLLSVLNRHGIAWGNWDYKGGFGLFTADGAPTAVLDALLR